MQQDAESPTMIRQRPKSCFSTLVAAVSVAAAAWGAENRVESGAKAAAEPVAVTIPLAAGHDTIGLSVTPGGKPFTQIVLEFADGSKKRLTLNVHPQTVRRRTPVPAGAPKDAKPAYEEVQAEDSLVVVSGMNLRLFARPNLFRYTDPQQDELLKRWDSLPAASQTFVHYEFRNHTDRVEMWINGCYAGVFPAEGGLRL